MVRRTIDLHQPVGQVAEVFGISERSAYKWLARFRDEGTKGIYDRSSRPKCSPKTTHPLRVARVLALSRRKLPAFQFAYVAKLAKSLLGICFLLKAPEEPLSRTGGGWGLISCSTSRLASLLGNGAPTITYFAMTPRFFKMAAALSSTSWPLRTSLIRPTQPTTGPSPSWRSARKARATPCRRIRTPRVRSRC